MSSPNPSQELQVVGPQETAPAPAVEPAPVVQEDHVDPLPPEDRILSPEETENFFKRGTVEDVPEAPTAEEVDQGEQVAEFFATPEAPKAPAAPVVQQQGQALQPQVPVAPQPVVPGVAPQAPVAGHSAQQQSPQETALAAQLQTSNAQIQNLQQQLTETRNAIAQPQQAQPGQQAQPQVPQFNMNVPEQYVVALSSEDPAVRQQALNQLVNGIAQTVHQQTMNDVRTQVQQVGPQVQQQISQEQESNRIQQDMYGTYPELSNMMEQVVAVAQNMQSTGMSNGTWTPELRDAIAERLSPMIPGLAQKVQSVRAARMPQQQVQQLLPQGQPQGLPPGVNPVQVQGGAHVPLAQPGPMLVRDAQGNISQVQPQQVQQLAGPQARPGGMGQVDPVLQDIWSTLGF